MQRNNPSSNISNLSTNLHQNQSKDHHSLTSSFNDFLKNTFNFASPSGNKSQTSSQSSSSATSTTSTTTSKNNKLPGGAAGGDADSTMNSSSKIENNNKNSPG